MNENLLAKLEALLFIYGEPLTLKRIHKILNRGRAGSAPAVTETAVNEALTALSEGLKKDDRGLTLILSHEEAQLVTKPEFTELLGEVVKEELNEALTPAALETLAVILYSGPLTRSIIDYIRGVNSTFILRSLLLRGLIDRAPDPERPNTYVYKPSFNLLKHLGISRIEDLPEYQRFKEIVDKLKL